MSPETIRERVTTIRLGHKQLADAAGLSQKSVGQILGGRSGGQYSSIVAINDALTAEEIRLRDYLLALHPVQKSDEEKAA